VLFDEQGIGDKQVPRLAHTLEPKEWFQVKKGYDFSDKIIMEG